MGCNWLNDIRGFTINTRLGKTARGGGISDGYLHFRTATTLQKTIHRYRSAVLQ